MDTIIAPRDKGQFEQGIVATLCDKRHFHLVFDQRLDVDIQPEREDFSFILGTEGEQKVPVESLKLTNGERDGKAWSVISFVLREPIPVGSPLRICYQARQVSLWSEDLDDVVAPFEISAIAEATNTLKAKDLGDVDLQHANPDSDMQEEEERWVKADLRVLEACDRSIRIGFKHKLDLRMRTPPEDFRAESDTRWLTIERVFLHPVPQGTELCLFLKEKIESDSCVEVAYKSSIASLQTIHGEKIENFRVEARAESEEPEATSEEDKAFADIDEILGLVEDDEANSSPEPEEADNVVPLFAEERKEPALQEERTDTQTLEKITGPTTDAEAVLKSDTESAVFSAKLAESSQDAPAEEENIAQQAKTLQNASDTDVPDATSEHSLQQSILSDRVLIQSKAPRDFISAPTLTRAIEVKASELTRETPDDSHAVGEALEPQELPAPGKLRFFDKVKQLDPLSLGILGVGSVIATWVLLALFHFASVIFSLDGAAKPQSLAQLAESNTSQTATPEVQADVKKVSSMPEQKNAPEPCERHYKDGSHFNGTCLSGMRHGGGNFTYPNGDQYSGQWENDHQHGSGMTRYANGDMYAGTYFEGLRQGNGTFRWSDGRVYEGEFENDAFHGQGKLIETDGRFFEGMFGYGETLDGVCTLPGGVRINGACDSF